MSSDAVRKIPDLKPYTAENVEMCGHVQQGAPISGFVAFQAAANLPLPSHGTLVCHRCAIATAEAVIAAVQREWVVSKDAAKGGA